MNSALYVNFATAILTFVAGVLILTGILFPAGDNGTMKVFGVVLILYGVYRFITSVSKMKQLKIIERREKLIEEKEKLLGK